MEHYTCKVMPSFENDAIPDYRKVLAATLLECRDNVDDDLQKLMDEELAFT